jgi:hypothetical protein
MKLTLSILLIAAWLVAVFCGAGLAIYALGYRPSVERWDLFLGIGFVLYPVGALVIVMLVYGRPTLNGRILVLLTAAGALAVLLYDLYAVTRPGAFPGHQYGLLRAAELVIVGLFLLWAFLWVVGAGKSAEKTSGESP